MGAAATGSSRKTVLGRYELERELSSDYIGRLWTARVASGPNTGSSVAIRRITESDSFSRAALDDLVKAALWTMKLEPRQFLTVTDVVRDHEELGIVLPWLDGNTLRGILRTASTTARPIMEGAVVRIICDLAEQCEGLSRAADKLCPFGHGGITPESVFIDRTGRTRLLDLGISAVAAQRALIRRHIAGASYFASEQLDGTSTERTDVFALGLLAWEMLAIRRPRYASTFRALSEKIRFGSIAHLSRVVRPGAPTVGNALGDVIACAVDSVPERRFANVKEFALALVRVVEPVTPAETALMLGLARASGIRRISRPPASSRPSAPPSAPRMYRDPQDTIPNETEEEHS